MSDAPVSITLGVNQWRIVQAAVGGLHAQLLAVTGPAADYRGSWSAAAVRAVGDVRWIERALREALGDPEP